jgi:hypothetical protein
LDQRHGQKVLAHDAAMGLPLRDGHLNSPPFSSIIKSCFAQQAKKTRKGLIELTF